MTEKGQSFEKNCDEWVLDLFNWSQMGEKAAEVHLLYNYPEIAEKYYDNFPSKVRQKKTVLQIITNYLEVFAKIPIR